ncbi:hypothetical protein SAMN02745178_00910 [Gemmiger formicilis]|uniref:Uncharacterized protein n=2 Tax=Gemmiger formicilis TaxID=745368 RepID=A0A1T4WPA0_9FIRM|nr:hypothetical protein SAMN02745178_00910 [Gemmiger formicilis]
MSMANKDKCFIITPIGDDTDPIRRHIEGIIDAALRPALEDKYDLVVAHRISEPGSITKQIITEIYSAKLVVANLTNRNPNVMYELALRHSLGKPVIMIAEKGTPLPSDIVMERTIFYQNDARGVIELRENIAAAEKEIDYDKTESPIYNVLHDVLKDRQIIEFSESQSISQEDDGNATVLKYILQKLTNLEDAVQTSRPLMQNAESRRCFDGVVFAFSYVKSTQPYQVEKLLMRLQRVTQIEQDISVVDVHIYEERKKIWVYTMGLSDKSNASDIYRSFAKTLSQFGFEGVKAIHP